MPSEARPSCRRSSQTRSSVRVSFNNPPPSLWQPFVHEGKTYDLSHLWPTTVKYEQPAYNKKPARIYTVEVEFSCHCFTRSIEDGEDVSPQLIYPGEDRVFDFQRYAFSGSLPEIIAQLPDRQCYQTGAGNYFCMEKQEGNETFEVYFRVDKLRKGRLKLFVQSAYIRDALHGGSRPAKNSIRFFVVLFNTLHEKPINCFR